MKQSLTRVLFSFQNIIVFCNEQPLSIPFNKLSTSKVIHFICHNSQKPEARKMSSLEKLLQSQQRCLPFHSYVVPENEQ